MNSDRRYRSSTAVYDDSTTTSTFLWFKINEFMIEFIGTESFFEFCCVRLYFVVLFTHWHTSDISPSFNFSNYVLIRELQAFVCRVITCDNQRLMKLMYVFWLIKCPPIFDSIEEMAQNSSFKIFNSTSISMNLFRLESVWHFVFIMFTILK